MEEVQVTGLSQWLFLTGLVVFLPEVGTNREGAGLTQESKRSSAGLSLRPGLTPVEMSFLDRECWGHRCWSPCPRGGILGGGLRREYRGWEEGWRWRGQEAGAQASREVRRFGVSESGPGSLWSSR